MEGNRACSNCGPSFGDTSLTSPTSVLWEALSHSWLRSYLTSQSRNSVISTVAVTNLAQGFKESARSPTRVDPLPCYESHCLLSPDSGSVHEEADDQWIIWVWGDREEQRPKDELGYEQWTIFIMWLRMKEVHLTEGKGPRGVPRPGLSKPILLCERWRKKVQDVRSERNIRVC